MALTYNGTSVALDSGSLPPDYTKPSVTIVDADWITTSDRVITMTKASVNDADHATMIGNIVSAVSTQVQTIINENFDTGTSNFTAYATLNKLQNDVGRNAIQDTITHFYASVTINVAKD